MMSQPAAPPPPPPTAPARRPGRLGTWVGLGLILLGIVGGIALIVVGARSVVVGVEELQRVPVASGGTIEVTEPGPVKVYAEREVSESAAKSFSSSSSGGPVPDVELSITDPDGIPVAITRVRGSEEYQSDGWWGTRIGRFEAGQAGTYTVEVVGGDDVQLYDGIAVGDSVQARGLWLILMGVLGGAFLVFVGVVVLIISLVRRSRAKRRHQGIASGPSYPPPGYAPPPPPPGWPTTPT
ncbi:MAG TPA: hypothetical protein VNS19_11240 [Acidimicrobiales bacterium]|nr:hypothetical protein [Acidimicrobiales bacterium]